MVMTVQAGDAPAPTVADGAVTIGERRVALREGSLVLEDAK